MQAMRRAGPAMRAIRGSGQAMRRGGQATRAMQPGSPETGSVPLSARTRLIGPRPAVELQIGAGPDEYYTRNHPPMAGMPEAGMAF